MLLARCSRVLGVVSLSVRLYCILYSFVEAPCLLQSVWHNPKNGKLLFLTSSCVNVFYPSIELNALLRLALHRFKFCPMCCPQFLSDCLWCCSWRSSGPCFLLPPCRAQLRWEIPVILLSLSPVSYNLSQCKWGFFIHIFHTDLCVSLFPYLFSGPRGWESSAEELEGDCHCSAGYPGGLLPYHPVCHPPHTR